MSDINKIYSNNLKTPFTLSYHLKKTDNLRVKGKLRTMVSYMPDKYGCSVVFTKRRIWFYLRERRIMQVIVKQKCLDLRIRTEKGWVETRIPEWEDFRRLTYYLGYLGVK